jgi:two-component system LytT family sensor kinase
MGDAYIRYMLVPAIGLAVAFVSEIVSLKKDQRVELLPAVMSVLTAYLVWGILVSVHSFFQSRGILERRFMLRMASLCLIAISTGIVVTLLMLWIWDIYFTGNPQPGLVLNACVLSGFGALFIITLYEALYLRENRELEKKLVNRLDHERMAAEMRLLGNELNPHFVFNSLTILSQLVSEKSDKAGAYLQKLSHIYKYLLVNKDKDLVPLQQELDFAGNYHDLLKVSHGQTLRLEERVQDAARRCMVVPLAMQLLVENAIKHNRFTEAGPLVITITADEDFLQISNNKSPRPYALESTRIGLGNLDARYRLLTGRGIEIMDGSKDVFTVKLPLIKQRRNL